MLPAGIILMWSGAIGNIPAGYVLCDGNNGTPDLRDRFIVGAGSSYPVNLRGGSQNHTHDFTSASHQHDIPAGAGMAAGANYADITTPNVATGTTDISGHLPPYHALFFIMKT